MAPAFCPGPCGPELAPRRGPRRRRGWAAALCVALLALAGAAAAPAGSTATMSTPPASRPIVPPEPAFRGQVLRVTDGDSLQVQALEGGKPVAVRLAGLDAPERCQAHGLAAREALRSLVGTGQVIVGAGRPDAYGRRLARVASAHEADLGRRLVAEGHAWSWRQGKDPGPYAAEEARARADQRGLWADPSPIEPREFRRTHGPCEAEPGRGALTIRP